MSNSECSSVMEKYLNMYIQAKNLSSPHLSVSLPSSIICVDGHISQSITCNGDSGGLLIFFFINCSHVYVLVLLAFLYFDILCTLIFLCITILCVDIFFLKYLLVDIFVCWQFFFWIFVLVSWHAFISSLVMKLDFLANRPLTPPSPLQDYSTCNSPRLLFHNF